MFLRPQKRSDLTNKNPNISTIASLKKGPSPEHCLQMLYSLAHKVSKLMKDNNLSVVHLQEFHPKQSNLLGMNVNSGQKVLLRLRHNNDPHMLLDEDSVMDTLLHELVHNTIGPHNHKFHELWDNFRQQQWGNMAQGLFNNFLGEGKKLGVGMGFKSLNGMLKIGGRQINIGKTPREMARLAALQRFEEHNKNFCSNKPSDDIDDDDDLKIIHLDDDEEIREIVIIDEDNEENVIEPILKKRKVEKQKDLSRKHLFKFSSDSKNKSEIEIIELSD
ncbi:hypothetical protein QEN19_004332 [Hanseniaspora menglaensis]